MKIMGRGNTARHKVSIWDRLTAPSAAIKEPDEQRQARLLSLVLFLLIPLGYFVTTILPILTGKIGIVLQDPAFYVAILSTLIIILLYILSRSRHYKVAATILVGFEVFSMYSISLLDHSSGEAFTLDYLVIPVIFASLFLPLGTVIVVAVVN